MKHLFCKVSVNLHVSPLWVLAAGELTASAGAPMLVFVLPLCLCSLSPSTYLSHFLSFLAPPLSDLGRVFPPVLTALPFPRRLAALFNMQSLISSRLRRGAAKIEMRDKRPIEAAGEPWLRSLLPPIYSRRALFGCVSLFLLLDLPFRIQNWETDG